MKINSIFNPGLDSDLKNRAFIIAEVGKNFIQSKDDKTVDEYLSNAKELARLAKEAGADAVKYQTHTVEDEQMNLTVMSPHFSGTDRYSWVKRNTEATPLRFWKELKAYCEKIGIIFFSTPMSRGAAKLLQGIDVSLWKIGSGDILDFVALDYIASTKKPLIISSGMSTLDEVDLMVDFLKRRKVQFALLHCVSKYPAQPHELHLNTIDFLKKRYDVPVGFSDHSIGYESAVAATAMGACIIEKHFSLRRDLWGSDHKVSMTPEEFKIMTGHIRNGTTMNVDNYGTEEKVLEDGEEVFRPFFRKALVYGADVKKGSVTRKEHIYAMRPQKFIEGVPSEAYENVLGKKLKKDVKKYDPVRFEELE